MAVAVGMGIGGEDVGRHVLGQIPFPVAGADREIDGGEVAALVAVAGPDDNTHQVAAAQFDRIEGADRRRLAGVARATREHLSGAAPPDLQRPERAVAAADVHALNPARDLHRSRDRAPPADDHPLVHLGMHGHAMGLHRAGNPELLVRRVGNHL